MFFFSAIEKKRWLLSLVDVNKDPVFTNEDKYFISRDKYYVRSLEKMKKLIQIKKQYNVGRDDLIFLMLSTSEVLHPMLVIKIFFFIVAVIYYETHNKTLIFFVHIM